MQESLISQILTFFYSLSLGVLLGFIYDIFRIVRMVINQKNIAVFLQDIFYFIISAIITFLFVLGVNNGDSRFYILAGEAIGWIAYHLTLGNLIYRASSKIVKWIKIKIDLLIQKLK